MADEEKRNKLATLLGDILTGGLGGTAAISDRKRRQLAEEEEARRQEQARLQAERQAQQDQLAASGRDEDRRQRLATMFKDLPEAHPLKQINLPRPGVAPGQGPGGITLPEVASGPAGSMGLMQQLFGGFETEDPTGALASTGALAGTMGAADEGALARSIQEKAREIAELARPKAEAAVVEEEITRPAKLETERQSDIVGFEGWERRAIYSHSLRLQEQDRADALARARDLQEDDPAEYAFGVALDLESVAGTAPISVWNEVMRDKLKEAFPGATTSEINSAASKGIKAWHKETREGGSDRMGSYSAAQKDGPTDRMGVRKALDELEESRSASFGGVSGGGSSSAGASSGEFDESKMSDEELRRLAGGS